MTILKSVDKLRCKFSLTIKICLHYISPDISYSRWGSLVNMSESGESKVGKRSVN
jgi:hypothetical protein